MSDSPYVPFYPSDWLAGTRGLTAAETGVYITLIAMMYEREAPLDMDHKRLARLCGCPAAGFQKIVDLLLSEGKLIVRDGGLWNVRVEKEVKKRAEKSGQARENAKARWSKPQENQRQSDADAMQTQCGSDANQNQNQNQIEDTDVSSTVAREASRTLVLVTAKAPPAKARASPRKQVPPPDWCATVEQRAYAADAGLTEEETDRAERSFRDWHQAERKARSPDGNFAAAWRVWVDRDAERRRGGMAGQAQPAGGRGRSSIAAAAARRLAGLGG